MKHSSKNNKHGGFELSLLHQTQAKQRNAMKTHHQAARLFAVIIGALILAFASCKKTPDTIGNDLIDENNIISINRTDTAFIVCHSYFDSIGTKNVRYGLLGSTHDPVFGNTEAGFYTQFRFSSAGQNFGTSSVLDSIVLQLALSSVYGDTTTLLTVHAYELNDSISTNDTYYNYSTIACSNIDLANAFQFRPHLKNNLQIIGSDTLTQPVIRIPLSQDLGNYFLQLDSTIYQTPDAFKNHFKGLFLTCDAVGQNGSISSINLTDNSLTRLQLYYHNTASPENALRYDFYITSDDNYFNHFDHDYTQGNAEFVNQLMEGDTTLGQQRVYLQTMGGIRTRILFPNLTRWADTVSQGHILINDAQLILPAPPDIDTTLFTAPSKLVLVGLKEDGSTFILSDNYEGDNYFGGSYNASSRTVTFRISEYLQKLILDDLANTGLSLGINGAAYNAQRWIVNGPEASEGNRMRLDVTYSIVNE